MSLAFGSDFRRFGLIRSQHRQFPEWSEDVPVVSPITIVPPVRESLEMLFLAGFLDWISTEGAVQDDTLHDHATNHDHLGGLFDPGRRFDDHNGVPSGSERADSAESLLPARRRPILPGGA